MKKYFSLILIIAISISSTVIAQKKLTLEDAISIALQRNSTLAKSYNNLMGNKSDVKSAYGGFLPSLGVSGGWSWSKTQDAGGQQVNFLGNLEDVPESSYDTRNYSLRAGGGITLFNGLTNYANLEASKNDLEAAKFSLDRLKEDIIAQTSEYYYNILAAQALVGVRKENLVYNQKFFETVEAMNSLGSVPLADVYNQQVQLGNAELSLIEAENMLDVAKNTLITYLALDVLEDYIYEMPSFEAQSSEQLLSDYKNLEQKVEQALNDRKDYKAQMLTLASRDSRITSAMGGLFPSLSGDYGFSTSATEPGKLFDRKVYSLGLTLSWNLFNGWNTENAIQYAEISAKNAEEDLLVLERNIKVQVKQGYLNLIAAMKGLDVSSKNVDAASENRRIAQERYNLGSATILDVLQSNRDYQEAQRGRIDAEFNYHISRERLLNYLGKLDFTRYEN